MSNVKNGIDKLRDEVRELVKELEAKLASDKLTEKEKEDLRAKIKKVLESTQLKLGAL